MIAPLRARVLEVLESAGFRNSENSLPAYAGGGVFAAIGGDSGVSVTVQRWDASTEELTELHDRIAAALRGAGLEVTEEDRRLYVHPPHDAGQPHVRLGPGMRAGPLAFGQVAGHARAQGQK